MSTAAFIGGNLDAISSSADTLDQTGADAVRSGADTKTAADELAGAITESTDLLVRRFHDIAEELRQRIGSAHAQLESTDWQGQSKDAAVQIKANLQSQVDKVLGTATGNLEGEKTAFINRANELVGHVETEFKNVMNQVNDEYAKLSKAARDTRANFELADQTIRMG